MDNNIGFGKGFYRSIPFFTPGLAMDSLGNYKCQIHGVVEFNRINVLFISSMALATLGISYMAGLNSSLVFTATLSFATPLVIVAGCMALGILGYKLDQMLTKRALTNVAIQEFIDKSNPSNKALNWLVADIERIKLLLLKIDLTKDALSKRDSDGEDLLLKAGEGFGNLEIFTLLCESASENHRAKTFINLKRGGGFQASKSLNYMVDAKQISAVMFSDEEKYELQNKSLGNLVKWTDDHLNWIEKLANLGFDIDAGKTTENIRYDISAAVFTVALDYAAGRRPSFISSNICAMMRFLQKNSKLEASRVLEGHFWDENMLEAIAPCLVATKTALTQAFYDDNVKIGRLLWEKTDSEDVRKASFIEKFSDKNNSKFVAYLLKEGKVSANMFTEKEQSDIFMQRCLFPSSEDDVDFVFLNKFVEFGFDIRVKDPKGKTFREVLSDQIASYTIFKHTKEVERLSKGLEAVDKVLEKQNIATGFVLKQGQLSVDDSNLTMFPDDILNYIVQTMVATH